MTEPKPFRVQVSDADLADLKARIARVRWPHEPQPNEDWAYGTPRAYLERLIPHWRDQFDWRAAEARINRFPQYTADFDLDGETHRIHFIWKKGSTSAPRPLILTHGWPSSFVEFLDVIEPLAHPERFGGRAEDAFDVVVPSLIGFGFSSQPKRPIGPAKIATLWHRLMTETLGFTTYFAQACDWGSYVTSRLALQHPDDLRAIHLTMLPLRPFLKHPSQPPLTEPEKVWIGQMKDWWAREDGYRAIQSTRPMALAYGVTDSPVGLAGWLADKINRLADTKKGHPYAGIEARFPHEVMCTMLSVYWFSGSINSANTIYKAAPAEGSGLLKPGERVTVPTAYTDYPIDSLPPTPESWGHRGYNIVRWRQMDRGGHFAAQEEPELFVKDVREAFANR
jgi:pimeloyl-ACP methyl ester carboxylesterase